MKSGELLGLDLDSLLKAFEKMAIECQESFMTEQEQGLWSKCSRLADEIVRAGGRDRLVALTDEKRPAVQFTAALLVRDFAPESTKRALVELRQGKGWIAYKANQFLGLFFKEYFDEVWNSPPNPVATAKVAAQFKKLREELGLPEPGTPTHPTFGVTREK
jgi:hypothetical protein